MQKLTPGSILGHAVRRREDPRLVTGTGHYVDDMQPEGCLHIAFVRSTLAHAMIRSLDVEAAAAAPGVVAVLTGADLDLPDRVGFPMVAGHFDSTREEDVLAGAEVKIRGRFVNQRLAPVPMEPEAILVVPEGRRLLVRATSQVPFGLRAEMASSLDMSPADIRVVVGDMGGGFGAKAGARSELIVVAAAARKLGRPVKW